MENMKILRSEYAGSVAAVLAALVLAGCFGKDASSYVKSARTYLARSDYKAAIIEAKNALQKEPDNAEARVLLATSLLEGGDPAGGEAEIRKAIALHAPDDRTYPLLARALAAQGQFSKIASEVGDRKIDDPHARSQVNVALAGAALVQGNATKAKDLADAALADNPESIPALLLEAQLAGARADLPAAGKFVDTALKKSPGDAGALMIKANIALAEQKPDDARTFFEQAITAHPDSIDARAALLSLEVRLGKLDKAREQLAKMKELRPKDVRTLYADALVAALSGDNAHARDAIQQVLAANPDHPPSLLLSGLVNYEL
jgi:cellulose synthase operon protein C